MLSSTLVQGIMKDNQALGLATGQLDRIKITGLSLAEDVSVTFKEDGIIMDCNHAGTHTEILPSNGGMTDERWDETTVCDGCGAQYISDEWII